MTPAAHGSAETRSPGGSPGIPRKQGNTATKQTKTDEDSQLLSDTQTKKGPLFPFLLLLHKNRPGHDGGKDSPMKLLNMRGTCLILRGGYLRWWTT